jgi:hypothetical protein
MAYHSLGQFVLGCTFGEEVVVLFLKDASCDERRRLKLLKSDTASELIYKARKRFYGITWGFATDFHWLHPRL